MPVSTVTNQFSLGKQLVGTTIDGGTKLKRRKATLEGNFENTGVFELGKPMFVMYSLVHDLINACKAGVMDVKFGKWASRYRGDQEEYATLHPLDKNPQKGAKALEEAQKHLGLPSSKLITPVKTSFAYIIHSFHSLLEKILTINFLYVSMEKHMTK